MNESLEKKKILIVEDPVELASLATGRDSTGLLFLLYDKRV